MLPSASVPVPATWRDLLEELAPVFARRSTHRLFVALACGMILADRSTVTGMAAAAGMADQWRRACWFFSHAVWDLDALGLAVAWLIVKYLLGDGEPVTVAVNGTFFKRWGKKVFQARWAYDGSAQGGKKVAFGNVWVIAAIVVKLPFCSSPVALPVLFRLWRGKGTASQVELAGQMLSCWWQRSRAGRCTGPGMRPSTARPWSWKGPPGRRGCRPTRCYTGRSRRRPAGAAGPGRKGTGWAPAPRSPPGLPGRPPSSMSTGRTPRCRSPPARRCGTAASRPPPAASCWPAGPAPVRLTTWGCSPSTPARTRPSSPSATPRRWSSSRRTQGKQLLGAGGDARNRVEKAVERTVPFAFLIQSLLTCWYARWGYDPAHIARRRVLCPWYRTKTEPSPADMLAALRRELLRTRFSAVPPGQDRAGQIGDYPSTCDTAAA